MITIKLFFVLLIIICAAFYILYIWDFSLVLLIVAVSVPILMYIMMTFTKRHITVNLALNEKTAAKNEPFNVQLCISNRSIFPVGKAEAHIEYYNIFNNQINAIDLYFPIQAHNSQRLTFQLNSKFCGIINISSAYITLFDPLRIFKFRIGKNINRTIAIIPEGRDIGASLSSTDRMIEESSVFSEFKPGDDPSEIFDLRGYCPGDKLNRIHWKLSSKKDDLIVKEYSLPIDSPTLIFIDLHCTEDSEYTLPLYDTLIESLVSVSQFLIDNGRIHTIAYYNASEERFAECTIDSENALISSVTELILSVRDDLHEESPELYFSKRPENSFASFTIITAEENRNFFTFIDEEIDADVKNAILIVKTENDTESTGKPYSSLNINPVVIGRITSSVKDLEL